MMNRFLRAIGFALFLCCIAHCAGTLSTGNGLLTRLNNRGPVSLSPDNPYLVGNLVLAREMSRSAVLRGFIAHRGGPPALEVTRSLFAPYRIILYYPDSREQYLYEPSGDEWIIDGPAPVEQEKLKDLALLTRSNIGEPKVLTGAELKVALGEPAAAKETEEAPATTTPTTAEPESHSNSSVKPLSEDRSRFHSPALAADIPAKGRSLAEIVQSTAAHPAEISPKGDLVHYVTLPGETLSILARWYTFDRNNAGRLARINGIKDPSTLTIGDIVIVPAYLVRNKNRLTQEGLDLVRSAAQAE